MKSCNMIFCMALLIMVPGNVRGTEPPNDTNIYMLKPWYKAGLVMEKMPERKGIGQKRKQGGFIELSTIGMVWPDKNWLLLSEVRGVLAGSDLTSTFDDQDIGRSQRTTDNSNFLQLRQLLVRYYGFTDYPGEYLAIGLQRIRTESSLWWDSELESVIWRFSGTRLRLQTGVGERFDTYKTGSRLTRVDQDKIRLFTEILYDWRAYHEITFRSMYSRQHSDDAPEDVFTSAPEGLNGEWFWYGFGLSSNWNKRRNKKSVFAYNIEWTGLSGRSDFMGKDGTALKGHTVNAWAFDAGLRYDCRTMLTSFGLTFSMGSGGFDNNESNLFVQTGLQSNRNRYVGNHQYMYRFNDALRPDLTNLIQESFFLSYTFQDTVEIAGVLSMLQRNDNSLPIYSNSKPLHMNDHSKDVGTGFDVSLRYDLHTSLFNIPLKFIRLRSSAFFPGDAFNKASNDTVYRFVLELVGTGE